MDQLPVTAEGKSVKPEPNLALASDLAAVSFPDAASVQQPPAVLSHDSVKMDQPSGATSELAGQLTEQAATTSSAPSLTHTMPPVPPATDAKLLTASRQHGEAVTLTTAGEPQAAPSKSKDQQLHVRTGASKKPGPAFQTVATDTSDAKLSGSIAAAVALVNAGKQGRARGKTNGYDTVLLPRYLHLPPLFAWCYCCCLCNSATSSGTARVLHELEIC